MGKVYIVGAGPGDPGLITVKGLESIKKADVVLYDRLVSKEILKYAPKSCLLIYVGKERGAHRYTQDDINRMLLEYSEKYDVVVRLKGGDPFIYGRGEEEMLYLKKHGVESIVIPGVSSVYAAPAYAGIPITNRELSSSVAILTGEEAAEKKSRRVKISEVAGRVDTLVILMGAGRYDRIIDEISSVLPGKTHIAVIVRGTFADQEVYTSTIDRALELKDRIKPPAIIVIGEVVKLHDKLYKNIK